MSRGDPSAFKYEKTFTKKRRDDDCVFISSRLLGFYQDWPQHQFFETPFRNPQGGTTDEYINVLAVFYSDAETIAERERELHRLHESDNFKGEWFHDTENVRHAPESCDREFNPERFVLQDLGE